MIKFLNRFEEWITIALVILLAIVLTLATIELGWEILQGIISPPIGILDQTEILDLFALFLLVLIGIELLDTIKAYLEEHVIHEEVILVAALIAVARKVIVLDVKKTDPLVIIGIAAIIAAVAMAYWIIKRMHQTRKE
ncbi:MAG: phosphate-starvation-inducible PsiE family protein [Chloroflexi bacterium]|nr:phosphate-starvation-inducible PsiE family protein [Chloroflexota bacterium]